LVAFQLEEISIMRRFADDLKRKSHSRLLRRVLFVAGAVVVAGAAPAKAQAQGGPVSPQSCGGGKISWLQQGFNSTHDGNNTCEHVLNAGNVGALAQFGGYPYSTAAGVEPVILTVVQNPMLSADAIFVNNDGNIGGSITSNLPPNHQAENGAFYTATPAIDPGFRYVYNVGQDGCVHKFGVLGEGEYCGQNQGMAGGCGPPGSGCFPAPSGGSGSSGWPEQYTANPTVEYADTALTIGTPPDGNGSSFLFVATAGDDNNGYQGSVTTINLSDGSQTVFNMLCADIATHISAGQCAFFGAGIWSRGGLPYDPTFGNGGPGLPFGPPTLSGRLFVPTANVLNATTYSPPYNWGESLVALGLPGGAVNMANPQDVSFPNPPDLTADLGSSNPLIFHSVGTHSAIAAWAGKDGFLRIVDLTSMGDNTVPPVATFALPGQIGANNVVTPMAGWLDPQGTPWVFLSTGAECSFPGGAGLVALKLTPNGTAINVTLGWQAPLASAQQRAGGVVVANNVLYWAQNGTNETVLQGFDLNATSPATPVLNQTYSVLGSRYSTPVVVNGAVYLNGLILTVGGLAPVGVGTN
jgi:hypothetical protein